MACGAKNTGEAVKDIFPFRNSYDTNSAGLCWVDWVDELEGVCPGPVMEAQFSLHSQNVE